MKCFFDNVHSFIFFEGDDNNFGKFYYFDIIEISGQGLSNRRRVLPESQPIGSQHFGN